MARRDEAPGSRQARQQVAQEAARLLAEHGSDDLAWARRKAAARLGVRDEAKLPGSDEILAALRGHRELFGRGDGASAAGLQRLLTAALEAMAYFEAFEPRLAGPLVRGEVGRDSPVRLHLHVDDPDAVQRRLLDRGIPARQKSRVMRLERGRGSDVPAWFFEADGIDFELLQLPLASLRQAPRDPLDDRPMERASMAAVKRMLDAGRQAGGA